MVSAIRILIVDDDEDFAESLVDLAEFEGHEVDHETSGEEGVRVAGNAAYNLIIVDMSLPGMNGIECMQEIKKMKPDVPVLLMTGHSAESLKQQAIEHGALEVMIKPLDLDSFLKRLSEIDAMRH